MTTPPFFKSYSLLKTTRLISNGVQVGCSLGGEGGIFSAFFFIICYVPEPKRSGTSTSSLLTEDTAPTTPCGYMCRVYEDLYGFQYPHPIHSPNAKQAEKQKTKKKKTKSLQNKTNCLIYFSSVTPPHTLHTPNPFQTPLWTSAKPATWGLIRNPPHHNCLPVRTATCLHSCSAGPARSCSSATRLRAMMLATQGHATGRHIALL